MSGSKMPGAQLRAVQMLGVKTLGSRLEVLKKVILLIFCSCFALSARAKDFRYEFKATPYKGSGLSVVVRERDEVLTINGTKVDKVLLPMAYENIEKIKKARKLKPQKKCERGRYYLQLAKSRINGCLDDANYSMLKETFMQLKYLVQVSNAN